MSIKVNTECARCGYIASNIETLIKHVKEEKMCPAVHSTISHTELLNKLRPPLDLTCKFCRLLCKSKSAQTSHIKYYCHLNPNRIDRKNIKSVNDTISTSGNGVQEHYRKYIHKNTPHTKGLHSFDKDIDWTTVNIIKSDMLKYITNLAQGVVDLFIDLHSQEHHKNIEWINNKLVVYDGKGWTEINETILSNHLGYLFSHMEECWCDYQMDVRCGNVISNVDDELTAKIDYFMYEQIVDDESVLFYCGDLLSEYLETIKSCS